MDRQRRERFEAAQSGLAANAAEERIDAGESLQSRLPTFGRELRRRRTGQETPAQGHLLLAVTVGKESEVADADEAIG